jgi:CheY-like chemotaxis protein
MPMTKCTYSSTCSDLVYTGISPPIRGLGDMLGVLMLIQSWCRWRSLSLGTWSPWRVRCLASASAERGARLVLIDDQMGMRNAVQNYLTQHGFECDAFASGADALRAMLTAPPPPDLIVADVLMKGVDGLSLLQRIRAEPMLCAVPLVLLTAKGLTSDRIAGYNAGASAYLTKPFDPDGRTSLIRPSEYPAKPDTCCVHRACCCHQCAALKLAAIAQLGACERAIGIEAGRSPLLQSHPPTESARSEVWMMSVGRRDGWAFWPARQQAALLL